MFDTSNHGGGCCGASHVFDFGFKVSEDLVLALKDRINLRLQLKEQTTARNREAGQIGYTETGRLRGCQAGTEAPYKDRDYSHMIEITLTDTQVKVWKKTLKEIGFKHLLRWFNDNSGNYNNLLTYVPENVPNDPAPFDWDKDEDIILPDENIRVVEQFRIPSRDELREPPRRVSDLLYRIDAFAWNTGTGETAR